MPEFVLRVPDIDHDGKDYRFSVKHAWLETALSGSDVRARSVDEAGRLAVRAQRCGSDILVTGQVTTCVSVDCVRCLEAASVPVDTPIHTLFSPRTGEVSRDEDEELTPEELARESFAGEEIILDALVRDHILLEVPMQPLCRSDCEGIAIPAHVRAPAEWASTGLYAGPAAPADDNIDPRLAPLQEFIRKGLPKE